jgi:L-fuculose-phosphate aldolase
MDEPKLRDQICEAGHDLWNRGLIGANEGNISCRLDAGRLLATPAGANKGKLAPESLAVIGNDGTPLGDTRASSEIELHLRIYKDRPEVQAVIHAHPTVATGFALAGRPMPPGLLPEADIVLGRVPIVPFAIPGTAAMGDAIAPLLAQHDVFLLASHGAVAVGASIEQAAIRMETLERVARVFLIAEMLGGSRPLPPEGIRWLAEF